MTGPKTYRSVPTEIEAMQWTGDNEVEIARWTMQVSESQRSPMNGLGFLCHPDLYPQARLWVNANQDWITISVGEWVAKDVHGFYPIKPDVFEVKYKPVTP